MSAWLGLKATQQMVYRMPTQRLPVSCLRILIFRVLFITACLFCLHWVLGKKKRFANSAYPTQWDDNFTVLDLYSYLIQMNGHCMVLGPRTDGRQEQHQGQVEISTLYIELVLVPCSDQCQFELGNVY